MPTTIAFRPLPSSGKACAPALASGGVEATAEMGERELNIAMFKFANAINKAGQDGSHDAKIRG